MKEGSMKEAAMDGRATAPYARPWHLRSLPHRQPASCRPLGFRVRQCQASSGQRFGIDQLNTEAAQANVFVLSTGKQLYM